MTRNVSTLLAAVLVVLAGCSGAVPGGPSDGTDTGDGSGGPAGLSGSSGTVNFYVSDEPNAIDDFEHLNVTITKVGFHATGEESEEPESTETETSESTETETPESTETETPESTETETSESTETETPESTDSDAEDGDQDRDDGEDWREFQVDSKTVDLTELKGDNATLVGQFELESGTYDKVFVYISDVNGTLTNGEQVNVKLPSERLHINQRFTVGANESVDFVYDITVFKAGKSGKYILKPVVSESGTDVPIQDVDEDDEADADAEDDRDDERADRNGTLDARFVGSVEPGESATVKVTREGQPVENATVVVDDTEYTTGADGTVTFDVPDEADELEVTIEYEDEEVELKRTFAGEGSPDDTEQNDGATSTSTSTSTPTTTATASS